MKTLRKNKIETRTPLDKVCNAIIVFVMAIFALSFVMMYIWMFMNSFRTYISYNKNPSNLFNFEGVSWATLFDNYKVIFSYTSKNVQMIDGHRVLVETSFLTMLKNSMIQISISAASGLIFPPAVGYVIAKYEFGLKKFLMGVIVALMCIPSIGTSVAIMAFYDTFHMLNTWWPSVLSLFSGLGFGVLLYGNYFRSIPWEYVESAKLDGASNLRAYISIMFPQAFPLLLAQLIMGFIGAWNDYMTPFLYMPNKPNIAYGIYKISSLYEDKYPIVFAGLVFTSTITLAIYACFSKTIMSSMSVGGVKG